MGFVAGFLIVFLIVYILLCGVVSSMGETRSIGSGPLLIISILFSPILGFFIALLYPSDEKYRRAAVSNRSGHLNSNKLCPMCAEEVKMAARICKHCNHQFNDTKVESDGHNETIDKQFEVVLMCFNCSNKSDVDSRWRTWVCPTCHSENQQWRNRF